MMMTLRRGKLEYYAKWAWLVTNLRCSYVYVSFVFNEYVVMT